MVGALARAGGRGGLRRPQTSRSASAPRPARSSPRCSAAGWASTSMLRHQRGIPMPARPRASGGTTSGTAAERCPPGRGSGWARRPAPAGRPGTRARSHRWPRSAPSCPAAAARWVRCAGWSRASPGRCPSPRTAGRAGRYARGRGWWRWTTAAGRRVAFGRDGRAAGDARTGRRRVLRDPGVVCAGRDRRPAVRRRRHQLAHLPRPARRAGPGRGVRAGADGVVRLRPAPLAGRPRRAAVAPGGDPPAAGRGGRPARSRAPR